MSNLTGVMTDLPILLKALWRHLDRRRQLQFRLLTILMLIAAFAEVVSLGAVLPFIGILAAPEEVFQHPYLAGFIQFLNVKSASELVLPLTIAFAVMALIAGAIRMFLLWASTRLAFLTGADLSIEAYRRTLYQSYRQHVDRNSSEVISGITYKVNGVVFGVLLPLLTIASSIILLLAIMGTLIVIDPAVALYTALGFGACYVVITWMSRRKLKLNSQRINQEQTRVVKALLEGLGG
ncbi:MAG: ABC transporter transmembrane domain-containing protein, partial [Pseudobdellovibrionaceae bacterium]